MKTSELAIKAGAEGLSPVELLLGIVRDENQSLTFRAQCAGIVLPYVTPRLANVQIERKTNNAVLDRLMQRIREAGVIDAQPAVPQLPPP